MEDPENMTTCIKKIFHKNNITSQVTDTIGANQKIHKILLGQFTWPDKY